MPIILWIDDDSCGFLNRKLLLQECGHELLTANSVRCAIEQFVNNPVDLLILDCHMACMDSHGIMALFRTLRPRLPIIMLSDFCPVSCNRAPEVDACFQKNESATTLLMAIRSLTSKTARVPDLRSA